MFGVRSMMRKPVVAAILCAAVATTTMAQDDSLRAELWDVSLGLKYAMDADFSGKGGSKIKFDDDLGFGFAAGYNINEHFQLGGSFNWDSRTYQATGIGKDGSRIPYNSSMETATIAMNAIVFLLPGNITPFVSGSIGYSFVDTGIQNGASTTQCYWDPWWGYVCSDYTPTRSRDGMSYGAGIGLRMDVSEVASFQLSYNQAWADIDTASSMPNFGSIRLDFIGRTF